MAQITKRTTLGEVVNKHPELIEVLLKHGLHCVGCHMAADETIEQGALAHGMGDEDIDKMIEEMNTVLEGRKKKGNNRASEK